MNSTTNTQVVSLADRVKERINTAIADLIPDDEMSRMVDYQLQRFISNELPDMIKAAIKEEMRVQIKTALDGPEFQAVWDVNTGSQGASAVVKKIMLENSAEIFANAVSGITQNTIQIIRNNRML